MWPKRRSWIDQLGSQHCPPFGSAAYNYPRQEASWEEQAFAEDTLMHVWPPRSYSCTFCRREFRSAQALGGHMNVHRRDRARLRQQQQQPSGPNSQVPDDRQNNPNTPPSDNHDAHNPSPDDCNHYPSSASAVNDPKPKDPRSAASQIVNIINEDEVLSVPKDLTQPEMGVGNLKRKDHCRVEKLKDHTISTKRRCIAPAEFPLSLMSNSPIQLQQLRNEVTIKSTSCPIEELDLELRLGNCPKVI